MHMQAIFDPHSAADTDTDTAFSATLEDSGPVTNVPLVVQMRADRYRETSLRCHDLQKHLRHATRRTAQLEYANAMLQIDITQTLAYVEQAQTREAMTQLRAERGDEAHRMLANLSQTTAPHVTTQRLKLALHGLDAKYRALTAAHQRSHAAPNRAVRTHMLPTLDFGPDAYPVCEIPIED